MQFTGLFFLTPAAYFQNTIRNSYFLESGIKWEKKQKTNVLRIKTSSQIRLLHCDSIITRSYSTLTPL